MRITVNDRVAYKVTRREYTDEGFLKVPGRVARSGIQEYLASELGLTDRAPNDIVKVYRPPEEVFNSDSLSTYAGADVTIEHPASFVDASTYKAVSVGTVVGPGTKDGDFVECNLIVKDSDGIKAVESGKVQLSAGYSAIYDSEVPEGADYDFIQRSIIINHVALVDRARAGAQAKLFDSNGVKPMKKIVLDSGHAVELQDDATATLVVDSMERLKKRAEDAETKSEQVQAAADSLKEENEKLKKQSSDSAIADRVKQIASTTDTARKIAGKEFTCDSVSIIDIQRAALKSKRPNVDWADKSDVYVQAAFDQAAEMSEEEEEENRESMDSASKSHRQLAADAAAQQEVSSNARQKAQDHIANGWKKSVGEQ